MGYLIIYIERMKRIKIIIKLSDDTDRCGAEVYRYIYALTSGLLIRVINHSYLNLI